MALFRFSMHIANCLKCTARIGTHRQASLMCNISSVSRPSLCKSKPIISGSKRSFFKIFKKPSVDKYKEIDDIPKHYSLIYKNAMERYVITAHAVTFATAVVVIGSLIIMSQSDTTDMHMEVDQWKDKIRKTDNEIVIYVTCAAAFAVLVHSLVLKFPLRIYKVPKQLKYVVIMNGPLPLTRKKLTCKAGNLKFIGKESIVPWKDSIYRVNNDRVVILLDNFFQRPADLYIMLGEQNDPDTSV